MNIILSRVAIWQPQLSDGLTVRKHSIGTPFQRKGSDIIERASAPMYRFAKNYERDGNRFCLFARTFINDPTTAEFELDKIASDLPDDYVRRIKVITANNPMDFEYTDFYILEDSPTEESE